MTFAYFDTSAVVKRYVRERGSARVMSLLGEHDFLSSAITLVEVLSALSRKKRDGELSENNFATTLNRIRSERDQWELVEVGEPVLNRAQEIVQGNVPVRALDAIHIASLVTFEAAAGVSVPFITADGRQRDAAKQMKLDVIWVGLGG
jgi:predicted nucleic acid-binding protein